MSRLTTRRTFLLQGVSLTQLPATLAAIPSNGLTLGSGKPGSGSATEAADIPSSDATIDIDTSVAKLVHPGFSGVNTDLNIPIEYWDYNFNSLAAQIDYGWLRFPAGTSSDVYDWQTGQVPSDWINEFSSHGSNPFNPDLSSLVAGRGGARLIDAAHRAKQLGAPLIICLNGFTDTPESIGRMAAYVRDHRIRVAAWELCNEPYLFPGYFPTATDYLDCMRPYRDAIKDVDCDAIISVFVSDQGKSTASTDPWNLAIAAYPHKYWDAISFHHYPAQSGPNIPFAQWMKDECAVLVTQTTDIIDNLTAMIGPPGVKFLITEFDSTSPNNAKGNQSITDASLWGGIYAAEFIMRMATEASVLHVGPHEIADISGVSIDDSKLGAIKSAVDAAAAAGKPLDTMSMDFGFYITAQAYGLAILNGVVNHAMRSNRTTVTGGETVPASGMDPIPALYATAFTNEHDGMSLVITNKSITPHTVTIRVDGLAVAGPLPQRFVCATDPSLMNSQGTKDIAIQTATSENPITVPPYSVLRADLTGYCVPG
ncbi:MAG: hypothetical protein P4L26_06220 [Terracidiphilus sp.]|nr:hypothetical protein [Terracidiphilus sp.]